MWLFVTKVCVWKRSFQLAFVLKFRVCDRVQNPPASYFLAKHELAKSNFEYSTTVIAYSHIKPIELVLVLIINRRACVCLKRISIEFIAEMLKIQTSRSANVASRARSFLCESGELCRRLLATLFAISNACALTLAFCWSALLDEWRRRVAILARIGISARALKVLLRYSRSVCEKIPRNGRKRSEQVRITHVSSKISKAMTTME